MCVNCALQVWETSVRSGGASAPQALIAAGATSVGARGVGNWLASRGFGWATRRRIAVATSLLVTVVLIAVVVGTAQRALY